MLTFLIILLYVGICMPLIIRSTRTVYCFACEEDLPKLKWRKSIIMALTGSFILTALIIISHYYNEILWFKELGYTSVFWTEFSAKIIIFFVSLIITFGVLSIPVIKTKRLAPPIPADAADAEERRQRREKGYWEGVYSDEYSYKTMRTRRKTVYIFSWAAIFIISLAASLTLAGDWSLFLQYFSQVPSGKLDPIFGNDLSFYLFSLPLYSELVLSITWLIIFAIVISIALDAIYYNQTDKVYYPNEKERKANKAKHLKEIFSSHFGYVVAFVILMCAAAKISAYGTLFSSGSALYGTSYTDVHAKFPCLIFICLVFLGSLYPIYQTLKNPSIKRAIITVSIMFVSWLLALVVVPALVESLFVKPSQLTKEAPYIQNHIKFTRDAYNLNKVTEKQFPATDDLSFNDIQNDDETISNIRLWDWHALLQALHQKQEIRQYYKFTGIDVDRYIVNGKYRQVMISAREISTTNLPANSKNWVNLHLKYTHGYGASLNLVNEFTDEGWPNLIVKNIPSVSSAPEVNIKRPEIYYGENVDEDVYVKSSTQEFDYPQGDQNVYCTYNGKGGVTLGGGLRKLSLALSFDGLTMLFSDYLKPDSRIMFNRNIKDRVNKIAPFLKYDEDPYLVIGHTGHLSWIIDAYTITNNYPYAQPSSGGFNYIRNSVKVVIDAYDGTTTFYIADQNDVLIKTWQNIFPNLFKPLAKMPADLQQHLRYPEDLLNVQGQIYGTYHMTDPNVFFNREDVWTRAQEKINDSLQDLEPYFGMVKLPGEKKAEFLEMLPFTPRAKQNLIGWIASRSDKGHYGELLVYKFPKDKQVQGTSQVEAKIDQNQEMSKDLSLWKQKGSEVIRGNMLVIPIKNSLLYVEPIYIQATSLSMPQLVKVAVAYGEKLVWADSFDAALREIFNVASDESMSLPMASKTSLVNNKLAKPIANNEALKQAAAYFNRYLELMGKGKAQEAGKAFEQLGKTLNQK